MHAKFHPDQWIKGWREILEKLFFWNLPKIYIHFKWELKLRLFQKLYLEF